MVRPRGGVAWLRCAASVQALLALLLACGETRRATGEECLRNDDCLSSVCSARVCVGSSPQVGSPAAPQSDDDEVPADAAAPVVDAGPKDAKGG